MPDSPTTEVKIGQVSHQWAQSQKIHSKHFNITDSTNTQAKNEAFLDESFNHQLILYFAEQQSQGRGRGQNTWLNAKVGSQLLCSWSFMASEAPQPTFTPQAGLALYKAACATWPFLNFSLKAPNDLFLNEKKVAGLLVETVSQGDEFRLIVGLGLNVISSPDLETSTSLAESLSSETPLLAEDWISFLERLFFELSFSLAAANEPLNSSTQASLLIALNSNPNLKEKYLSLDENGNLKTSVRSIAWSDL